MFILTLCLFLSHAFCQNIINVEPKTWEINMEESAEKRLGPLCEEYGIFVYDIYENMKNVVGLKEFDSLELILLNWFNKNAVDPYRSEIEYISKCAKVPLGAVVVINLLYDMTAGCTSIIGSKINGVIYHGRDLDYGQIPSLRNATYIAKYINNKKEILYTGIPFFGYVGLWTGVKYNKFSLSGNERHVGSLIDNIYAIHDDYWPSGWLMREVLSMDNVTFNDALIILNNTKIMASVYYILGGLYYPNGAIITRDQLYSYNLWLLNGTALNHTNNYLDWFIVETNDDWWEPPNDERRNDAIKYMNKMGQNNLNEMNLWNDVMSGNAVLNDGTLYTTVMSASNKSLCVGYTRVRYPQ